MKKEGRYFKGEKPIGIPLCNITSKIGTLENAGSLRNVRWAFCFVKHPTFRGGKDMFDKVLLGYTSKIRVSFDLCCGVISFAQIFLMGVDRVYDYLL